MAFGNLKALNKSGGRSRGVPKNGARRTRRRHELLEQ
jgi:hypothetical protein